MEELESCALELVNAVTRARRSFSSDEARGVLDAIERHVGDALGRMRFEIRGPGELRAATFSPGAPTLPAGPMFPALAAVRPRDGHAAEALCALIDALELLQRRLVFEADCQEYVDAPNNASQYLRAAHHLDLAAPLVVTLTRLDP